MIIGFRSKHTSAVPIDVSEAPGSENGSTDPSPAAEPAAPNAPVAEPTVPIVPAVAPPASEPYSGPDLADGLSQEDEEAALAAVFAREQVEAVRLAEALAAKDQLEADALAAKKRLEADALEELEKVGETRDAVRAANHARHADAAPVPTQPAPLPESVQAARTPISAQQVEDEQESVRLEAAARLAQAEKTVFAASEAKAEAAVAKAAADDAAIEEADRICAEGLKN